MRLLQLRFLLLGPRSLVQPSIDVCVASPLLLAAEAAVEWALVSSNNPRLHRRAWQLMDADQPPPPRVGSRARRRASAPGLAPPTCASRLRCRRGCGHAGGAVGDCVQVVLHAAGLELRRRGGSSAA